MRHSIDNKDHQEKRALLRIVGIFVLGLGLLFTAIGLISFFSSFGSFSPPRYFWCVFIGLPLTGIGLGICKFAFLGAMTRFVASEVAPVGKDTVNYMADGTKDAIRDVASAIGEGLSTSMGGQEMAMVRCHKCNSNNDAVASFCNACGASLTKSVSCPKCNELNDPDAKFCDNCGEPVV